MVLPGEVDSTEDIVALADIQIFLLKYNADHIGRVGHKKMKDNTTNTVHYFEANRILQAELKHTQNERETYSHMQTHKHTHTNFTEDSF